MVEYVSTKSSNRSSVSNGQVNNVQVYKLIMKNSIEEKIQKLQEQKQDLSNIFIENNTNNITKMSTSEIISLFSND